MRDDASFKRLAERFREAPGALCPRTSCRRVTRSTFRAWPSPQSAKPASGTSASACTARVNTRPSCAMRRIQCSCSTSRGTGISPAHAAWRLSVPASLRRKGGAERGSWRRTLSTPTVAVLGTPITTCYPPENAELQKRIAGEYLVISQVPIVRYSRRGTPCNRGDGQNTCPVRMADAIADLAPELVVVGNFLRHKAQQPKAHSEGGTRNPHTIAAALASNVTDKSRPIVLVDDVKTTGGHLLAAARLLRNRGVTVEHVLVAGRAVWEAVEDPYKVRAEDLEANPFDDLI